MSPASAGSLEVERYIGACLISQNRKNRSAAATVNKVRNNDYYQERNFIPPDVYHQQHMNYRIQQCQDGWAGGMPLISFANHQRRLKKNENDNSQKVVDDPLTRLAVHTKGAPLIVTKSYNHRKNKVHRNNNGNNQTKIFENSNVKKQNKCHDQQRQSNNVNTDTVSVTSDESSVSNNSENCLPRIIKPRKRRKKDRKPPLLARPFNQDGFSTDSNSPDVDNSQNNVLSLNQLVPFTFDLYGSSYKTSKPVSLIDRLYILGDISETPKLHHSFEDVEEPNDAKDINDNETSCQCRYCDPAGQIWDVDRFCYSPFLTPPVTQTTANKYSKFNFLNSNQDKDYSLDVSMNCLEHSMSSVSLEQEENNKKIPPSRSSSSSSCRDLEVSTEIVTSLNGHRDLEIKFFSLPSSESVKNRVSDKNVVNSDEKCIVNKNGFVSEE